jgi:hypothetical protein
MMGSFCLSDLSYFIISAKPEYPAMFFCFISGLLAIFLVLFACRWRAGHGKHIRHPQNEETALIAAAQGGHFDCVRELLQGGADKEAKGEVRDII